MQRKQKLNPVELALYMEYRDTFYQNRVSDLTGLWKHAENGVPAKRPKRTKFQSCSKCKGSFNPDSDNTVVNSNVSAYQFKERFLFLNKDLCLSCLEDIESKL